MRVETITPTRNAESLTFREKSAQQSQANRCGIPSNAESFVEFGRNPLKDDFSNVSRTRLINPEFDVANLAHILRNIGPIIDEDRKFY